MKKSELRKIIKEEIKLMLEFKRPKPPTSLFKYKKLSNAISASKRWLIQKADKIGVWENFGQDIIRELKYKYIDISSYTDEENNKRKLLDAFDNWCMNYDGVR